MPDTNQTMKYLLSILFAALPAMALAGSLGAFHQPSKATEPSSLGFYGAVNSLPILSASNLNEEATANTSNSGSANINVSVNGQSVAVPANGSSQQSIPVNDGSGAQTKVDISAHNSSSNGRTSSQLNIQTNTSSVINTEQTDN